MKIACPKCQATYEVALPPLGAAGIELKCAVCHHPFRIKKKASKRASPPRAAGPGSGTPASTPKPKTVDTPPPAVSQMMETPDPDFELPETLDFDDELLDLDLPDEVTTPDSAEWMDMPETRDWEKAADSAKALEDQELEEAAQHAEEFANGTTAQPEPAPAPEETVAEGVDGVVDPEIWMDAFADEPTLDPAETARTDSEEQDVPFEDPDMWAEAFADQTAETPPPDSAAPAAALDEEEDPGLIDPADAWAEMFAEQTPEDDQWNKAMTESEIMSDLSLQQEPPKEVPPEKPKEVPPEPEPVPAPPPEEVPPPPPEVPPQPKGPAKEKSWTDLESELDNLEEQRQQLKRKSSDTKLKELEEQRLMLELERQKMQGESVQEEAPSPELAANAGPAPEPKPQAETPSQSETGDVAADMPEDDLDVIGLDEEFADQEKEVIGLDEEFARAQAADSRYESAPAAAVDKTVDELLASEFDEAETGDTAPVTAKAAPEPVLEETVHPESASAQKEKTPAVAEASATPLQSNFSALENLSGDVFGGSRSDSEKTKASRPESAMFDDLSGAGNTDWGADLPDMPVTGQKSAVASEEPDDFTAAFFGQSGQPDLPPATGRDDTQQTEAAAPNTNWTDSLGTEDEDEGLTKEEMWEREFPILEGDAEEEENAMAPVARDADDPFSDVSTEENYDEDYADEYEDARPIVIDSEYGEAGSEEGEAFEGVDDSAYEDYDEEEDYDLAFQPRKVGPFSVPPGRKGNVILVSVVVGLLLLAGTGYFVMKTFTPDELTDLMVANGDVPENMVPHENGNAKTEPPTTNPEVQNLLSETKEEQKLGIDELMNNTSPVPPAPKPEPETEVAEKTPTPEPVNKLEEATKLLEPSADNELLKELEQSQVLKESQKEIDTAVKQEEKLAEFIDPNATIVAFNTILPVAYNTTDIRVLSFRLEIEMDTADGAEVMRKALPVYEDIMVSTVEGFFKQRFYTDVVYAKEKLRDKLREVFDKSIENGKIQKANFTDFAIQ